MTFEAASPAQPMHGGTGFGTLRTANLDVTGSTAKEYTLATDADGQMRTWDLASASPAGQSWTTATRPCFVDAGSTWALTVARGKRGRSYRREPTMPLAAHRRHDDAQVDRPRIGDRDGTDVVREHLSSRHRALLEPPCGFQLNSARWGPTRGGCV